MILFISVLAGFSVLARSAKLHGEAALGSIKCRAIADLFHGNFGVIRSGACNGHGATAMMAALCESDAP